MADQTQSPASQPSITLSGLSYSLAISGTPTARALRELSLSATGESISIGLPTALGGRAMGQGVTVSPTRASGLFTPNQQSLAERLGIWPKYESKIPNTSVRAVATTVTTKANSPSFTLDEFFGNVTLLLHMNGSNGSTIFEDSSRVPKSVTVFGNAKISTAQSKFGGGSALFDGNLDYIRMNASDDLQFPGDFTIELWVYPLGVADYVIGSSISDPNTQVFRLNENGVAGRLSFYLNGTQVFGATEASIIPNAWYHLAISRSGSSTRMFVNGIQIGPPNESWTGTFRMDVIGTLFLNGSRSGAGYDFNGYIDELRITKGIARYESSFTPPTAPFPDA